MNCTFSEGLFACASFFCSFTEHGQWKTGKTTILWRRTVRYKQGKNICYKEQFHWAYPKNIFWGLNETRACYVEFLDFHHQLRRPKYRKGNKRVSVSEEASLTNGTTNWLSLRSDTWSSSRLLVLLATQISLKSLNRGSETEWAL